MNDLERNYAAFGTSTTNVVNNKDVAMQSTLKKKEVSFELFLIKKTFILV